MAGGSEVAGADFFEVGGVGHGFFVGEFATGFDPGLTSESFSSALHSSCCAARAPARTVDGSMRRELESGSSFEKNCVIDSMIPLRFAILLPFAAFAGGALSRQVTTARAIVRQRRVDGGSMSRILGTPAVQPQAGRQFPIRDSQILADPGGS